MSPIRCFLVQPTGDSRISLRRFTYSRDKSCPDSCPYGHDASVAIDVRRTLYDGQNIAGVSTPRDDPRWPTTCEACGYEFQPGDQGQTTQNALYAPAPGNEGVEPNLWTVQELPAGAMFFPSWMQPKPGEEFDYNHHCCPTDNSVLLVRVPDQPDGTGATDWIVDAYCSNCDRRGQKHHCWCRRGTAPWITVDKTPPPDGLGTCTAGSGSIWTRMPHGWHGFLCDGWLVQA